MFCSRKSKLVIKDYFLESSQLARRLKAKIYRPYTGIIDFSYLLPKCNIINSD
jgi:hypothetical protein